MTPRVPDPGSRSRKVSSFNADSDRFVLFGKPVLWRCDDDLRVLADKFLLDLEMIRGDSGNGEIEFHVFPVSACGFAVTDL